MGRCHSKPAAPPATAAAGSGGGQEAPRPKSSAPKGKEHAKAKAPKSAEVPSEAGKIAEVPPEATREPPEEESALPSTRASTKDDDAAVEFEPETPGGNGNAAEEEKKQDGTTASGARTFVASLNPKFRSSLVKREFDHSAGTNAIGDDEENGGGDDDEDDAENVPGMVATDVEEYIETARRCMERLDERYGAGVGFTSAGDAVVVMEAWNKALAFRTMWQEAMATKWRILVARHELDESEKKAGQNGGGDDGGGPKTPSPLQRHRESLDRVENNRDPLAVALGTRLFHLPTLLVGMVDGAVRSLCPQRQCVQREAYRPINDDLRIVGADENVGDGGIGELQRFALVEGTFKEYARLFARCGVRPYHWILFADAFLWTMETHNPYANDVDREDLEKGTGSSAHSAFVAGHVSKPAIQEGIDLRKELDTPVFKIGVRRFWSRVALESEAKASIGESFYRQLLSNHPELLDYFAKADMDSLALHLVLALDLLVKSIEKIGTSGTTFRSVLEHLGEMHRKLSIPTFSFPIVGGQLLKTLRPLLEEEERISIKENWDSPFLTDELQNSFAVLYMEIMSIVYHPMVREEKLVADAVEFYDSVAKELNWSPDKLNRRLLEIKLEIQGTSTYTHTSEELEIGARLAWRNSSKCIGRIAWNTLMVRDCRHVDTPREIFKEVEEHLTIATAGTNIQSVMTIFKPKRVDETWGVRFWSSQFVRYAGYENNDGSILGDPANVEFTKFLLRKNMWTPPDPKSNFDVLPVVLKMPNDPNPAVYQLPKQYVHEVHLEHPDCPAIKDLGYRWASVPAISNFNMNLGGVDYQCCPFNGWFVSIEVVRNLMERYKVCDIWANAMGIDKSQKLLEMRMSHEVQRAVLHSFEKQGFTMVDPEQVGNSFLVHCKRERDAGRECPGQWSWIGGLVGPTNVTWHTEMRDFRLLPQYDYCSESWLVTDAPESLTAVESSSDMEDTNGMAHVASATSVESMGKTNAGGGTPRVLIVYGSETGTGEAAALRLGRSLRLLKPTVKDLDQVAGLGVAKEKHITHLIAVCSTFNRGEFPTNAREFIATPIPAGILSNVKLAVLALGSSLYPDYCKAGVQLDQMLRKAGGTPFMQLTKVDNSTGSEGPISDWVALMQRLILPPHLEQALSAKAGMDVKPIEHVMKWLEPVRDAKLEIERFTWSEDESYECIQNDELITNGDVDVRSTRCISFRLPSGVTYESGDHLSVQPLTSIGTIRRFVSCFEEELKEAAIQTGACPCVDENGEGALEDIVNWQLHQPFAVDTIDNDEVYPAQLPFSTPMTLAEALQVHVDLTLRSSLVVDLLALVKQALVDAPKALEKEDKDMKMTLLRYHRRCTDGTSNMKQTAIEEFLSDYPTMIEFLEQYRPLLCSKKKLNAGTCGYLLPLSKVLTSLPRLQSRHYSISSSPIDDPSRVSISVGVLHVKTATDVMIHGVCSNYLARIRPFQDRVSCSIHTSSFRAPKDPKAPMIMIGTGTGLAPMMGFLADRAHAHNNSENPSEVGPCDLYFGCRSEEDRIYSDVIDKWEDDGVLRHHLALSRQPNVAKTYVQDKLEFSGKALYDLLVDVNAHYYICGDAKVADYCFESCVSVLRKFGNMSRVAAVQKIKAMRAEERWQFDLWGNISHFNESKLESRKKRNSNNARNWLIKFAD